jgi:hypothetical protein
VSGHGARWALCAWLVASVAFVPVAPAQDAGVVDFSPRETERRVSAEKVKLGDPFTYEVVLHHVPAFRYELRAGDYGAFELLENKRRREDTATGSTTTVTLKLALFELGEHELPALTFEVVGPSGAGTWVLPGKKVEAVSTLAPDADEKGEALADLKPLEEVPVRTYRLLWALLGLLVAGALGWALYRWWKRPRAAPVVVVQAPVPLHERTVRALESLAAEDLPGKGRTKEFYFRLSDILRGYLGERFAFEALECTSSELLESLRKRHTPGLPFEALSAFVGEADLVKFAKAEMGPLECKRALEFGHRLVAATPFPPPPPTTTGGPRPHAA